MAFKPVRKNTQNLPSFRYGMNTQQQSDEISDFEMADCENISIASDSVMSAPGYVSSDASSNEGAYWGIYSFIKSTGVLVNIRQRKGILEYADNGGTTWVACTLPTVGSPAATVSLNQVQPTFATMNNICVFANGQVVMYSTDGHTWTNKTNLMVTGIPDIVFNGGKNRLIYAFKNSSEIWWSEINDPLNVLVASWQYIDPNAGNNLVGLGLTPTGSILVLKSNGVYEIDDVTSGMVGVNFVGKAECINHHTVCTTKQSVIWMGNSAIYEFIGGFIRNIAGKINWNGRNDCPLSSSYATAVYYNGKYRLSMPDADISQGYNSQEYVIDLNLPRDDMTQPYAITRNRRYFGCYGVEDFTFNTGRTIKLYAGDSRTGTYGSPATYYSNFCFINDSRDTDLTQGLAGEVQDCWFITKFFTNNIPFFIKKFKKAMSQFQITNDTKFTLGYRFTPNGIFTAVGSSFTTSDIDWIFDDNSSGHWDDGFGFVDNVSLLGTFTTRLENEEQPRGTQFKVSWSQVSDVTLLGLAYEYTSKNKFK